MVADLGAVCSASTVECEACEFEVVSVESVVVFEIDEVRVECCRSVTGLPLI